MLIIPQQNLSAEVLDILEQFREAVGLLGAGMPEGSYHANSATADLRGKHKQAGIAGYSFGETFHLPRYADFLPEQRDKLAKLTSSKPLERTGFIVYLPNSGMGWHTNSNRPGKRFYYTYRFPGSAPNYFWAAIDGQEYSYLEPDGWHMKEFFIPGKAGESFPHAVEANSFRISIGFRAPD